MKPNLKALLEKLLQSKIDFVLVGGFACTVHGSSLVTEDLDICIAINEEQVKKLRESLKNLSPKHRMNPSFKPSFLTHPEKVDGLKNIYLETNLGILDILGEVQPIGDFKAVKSHAIALSLYGHRCYVIALDDLIKVKESMKRPKDKEAATQLKAIRDRLKKK
jgi:hypothetical protein